MGLYVGFNWAWSAFFGGGSGGGRLGTSKGENVTARGQVRDDGRRRIACGGRSEASGGGIFCG
jgi:hypothetical protein